MIVTLNARGASIPLPSKMFEVTKGITAIKLPPELLAQIKKGSKIDNPFWVALLTFGAGFWVTLKTTAVSAATVATVMAPVAVGAVGAASKGASIADRLMPLLHMVQDLALPIGIVVSSWGLIEIIMGNFESGKHKLKYAILGYCGMFMVPEIFYAIRDAFGSGLASGMV